jgi:hypothetical protein
MTDLRYRFERGGLYALGIASIVLCAVSGSYAGEATPDIGGTAGFVVGAAVGVAGASLIWHIGHFGMGLGYRPEDR